jgi:hypothetical protein
MESWAHEGARDKDVDSIDAIVEEGVDAEDDLVENTYGRRHIRFAKFGNMSGNMTVFPAPSMRRTGLV